MNTITTVAQIKERIPYGFFNTIIEQARAGDPDWLLDLAREHNQGILPTSVFYIKGFHSWFTQNEIFDIDAIYKSLIKHINSTFA